MKLVVVSDIHGDIRLAKQAVNLANKHKCHILCAGDVLDWEKRHQDKFFVKVLNVFFKSKKKVYMIPGSHEDLHLFYNEYDEKYIKKVKGKYYDHIVRLQVGAFDLGSHILVLYGGSDSVINVLLKKTYLRASPRRDLIMLRSMLDQKKPVVLMTHIPPKSYLDTACYKIVGKSKLITHVAPASFDDPSAIKEHVGNKYLKKIVELYTPQLCIFGHIHESAGSEELFSHKKTRRSSHLLLNTAKEVHLVELTKKYTRIIK